MLGDQSRLYIASCAARRVLSCKWRESDELRSRLVVESSELRAMSGKLRVAKVSCGVAPVGVGVGICTLKKEL